MSPGSQKKWRVMVVDDEATIRKLFCAILDSRLPDVEVESAINGAEALVTFLKNRPDVIVMDLRMPIMDGLTAFEEIEKACRKKGWSLPRVIFCTGFTPPPAMERLQGYGTDHILIHKPVTADQLVNSVQERLQSLKS